MSFVYLNGNIILEEDASVSVFDRGFLYGDAVFETMRAYNGAVYLMDSHLNRLFSALDTIHIKPSVSKDDLKAAVYFLLEKNKLSSAYIRVTISRGIGETGLVIQPECEETVVIHTKELPPKSEEKYKYGIKLIDLIYSSNPVNAIKSCNYLHNILMKSEAVKRGADDAVIIDEKGCVYECTTSNIFMIKDGCIITPPLSRNILPGIIRGDIILLAHEIGIPVKEEDFVINELADADESFITNSGVIILSVNELCGRRVWGKTPGKITKLLMDRMRLRIDTAQLADSKHRPVVVGSKKI